MMALETGGDDQSRVTFSIDFNLAQLVVALALVALTSILLASFLWLRYFLKRRHVLEGSVCCVIGASKGIGRASAEELSRRGATALLLVDVLDCEKTKAACKELGCASIYTMKCDVTKDSDLAALKELPIVRDVWIVIDCAGVVTGKSFAELSVAEFRRVMDVNCVGAFALSKIFVPQMVAKNKGCFVTVSSLMGLMGGAKLSEYCASKFALVGLMEALRMEVGYSAPGVSLVTVCPYAVDTGMFEGIFEATFLTRLIRRLFPILTADRTARAIISATERGNAVVAVPFIFGPLINIVRCLPSPLYEFVLTMMGGRDGMNQYRGKSNVWGNQI